MRTSAIGLLATGTLLVSTLILTSCSGSGPQEGSPAYYWDAAKETFAARDFGKTLQHLEKITATDNEYTARARPWLLVMTSGMARGYIYLADSFEAGARSNKTNPTDFRRRTNAYRGQANRLALEFVEVFDKFQKTKDDPVPLAMPFPTGSVGPVVQLTRASAGMTLTQNEIDPAERSAVERGVLLVACETAGSPEDPAKTQELLKSGTLQIPRAQFVTALAGTLYDVSSLYGPRGMDDPQKAKILCNRALDALKTVPETKRTKDLSAKIGKSLKKS